MVKGAKPVFEKLGEGESAEEIMAPSMPFESVGPDGRKKVTWVEEVALAA